MSTTTTSTGGHVYIIYPCQFKLTSAPVYKVGRTSNVHKRLRQYGGNSEVVCSEKVHDMYESERELLSLFRTHFNSENAIGNEYFSGDINKMKELFDLVTTVGEDGGHDGSPVSTHVTEHKYMLSITASLWAAFFDEHFPIETETYNKSTSLIMKHSASEIDYFIRDVYNVQSIFKVLNSAADIKLTQAIEEQFRDFDKFKTLKNALPTLRRLEMLKSLFLSGNDDVLCPTLKLSTLRRNEASDNDCKFKFLASFHIDITEAIINIVKRIGLTSPLDFNTEFTNDDIELIGDNIVDITHIRDKLFRWPNRTKVPSTLKGVFTHVMFDLFGLMMVESSRRRVSGKQPTEKRKRQPKANTETTAEVKKTKGAPRFQFYKLAVDPYVEQMSKLIDGIVVVEDEAEVTPQKPTKPLKTTKPAKPSKPAKTSKETGKPKQSQSQKPQMQTADQEPILTTKRKDTEPDATWHSDGSVTYPKKSKIVDDSVAQENSGPPPPPPPSQPSPRPMQSSSPLTGTLTGTAVKINQNPNSNEIIQEPSPPLHVVGLLGPDYILRFTLWVKLYRAIEQEFHKPSPEWRISKFVWQALEERGWTSGLCFDGGFPPEGGIAILSPVDPALRSASPQPHILSLEDRMRRYAKDRNGKSFFNLLCKRFGEKELRRQEMKGTKDSNDSSLEGGDGVSTGTTSSSSSSESLALIAKIDEMLLGFD